MRQLARILTHSASQGGGGGGYVASSCLFLQQDGPHSSFFYVQPCPASVACFKHTVTVFPSIWHLSLVGGLVII